MRWSIRCRPSTWISVSTVSPSTTNFPGWHQQATILELLVNREAWNALGDQQRAQIEAACGTNLQRTNLQRTNLQHTIAEGEAIQYAALAELQARGVVIHRWSSGNARRIREGMARSRRGSCPGRSGLPAGVGLIAGVSRRSRRVAGARLPRIGRAARSPARERRAPKPRRGAPPAPHWARSGRLGRLAGRLIAPPAPAGVLQRHDYTQHDQTKGINDLLRGPARLLDIDGRHVIAEVHAGCLGRAVEGEIGHGEAAILGSRPTMRRSFWVSLDEGNTRANPEEMSRFLRLKYRQVASKLPIYVRPSKWLLRPSLLGRRIHNIWEGTRCVS